jgi:thiol-disulfide isomerase/thioredoxin
VKSFAATILALTSVAISFAATTQPSQQIQLPPLTSGLVQRLGYHSTRTLELTETRPPTLLHPPRNLNSPLYGVVPIGNKSLSRTFHVILDGNNFYIDARGDGDLSQAQPSEWRDQTFLNDDHKPFTARSATGVVDLGPEGRPVLATLIFTAATARSIHFYADYARAGRVQFGAKAYDVILEDKFTTGDFSGQTHPATPNEAENPIRLLIDRSATGRFAATDKYNAFAPFTIDGVTYVLSDITAAGDLFTLRQSAAAVAELPVPPDHGLGKVITPFVATTMDNATVHFPADYKGKIVALDFWATWCGPCLADAPKLANAFERFGTHGFAVLGVSLDGAGDEAKLRAYTRDEHMYWPEVFDGKMWDSPLVMKYGLSSIPSLYLVDGDTGIIVAGPDQMHAGDIEREIEKAMAGRNPQPKINP